MNFPKINSNISNHQVTLHVYEVSDSAVIGQLDALTKDKVKVFGVFHAAVQIECEANP